jgi:hypothetical protein
MSEYELQAQWQRIRGLPHHRIEWREEVIDPSGQVVHLCGAAGSPDEAIQRWRALLLRCRSNHQWYAARLTILLP